MLDALFARVWVSRLGLFIAPSDSSSLPLLSNAINKSNTSDTAGVARVRFTSAQKGTSQINTVRKNDYSARSVFAGGPLWEAARTRTTVFGFSIHVSFV